MSNPEQSVAERSVPGGSAQQGPAARSGFPGVRVGYIPVAVADLDSASTWFLEWAKGHRGGVAVRLVNAHSVESAGGDESYGRLLSAPRGVNFPDGLPLVKAMNLLGGAKGREARQGRGPSFFESLLSQSSELGLRHTFVGGSPQTLEALLRRVAERYPGVRIAGAIPLPIVRSTRHILPT